MGKFGIKIPSMHKNKYKILCYSRIMRDLHYVGKQRDEIKNVDSMEIQKEFMNFVFMTSVCGL